MKLMQGYIDRIIATALDEDISYYDVTTELLITPDMVSTADFIAKDDGVVCGIDIAVRVFELAGGKVEAKLFKHDGDTVKKGDIIASIFGCTQTILKGERTALNLMQLLSGTATATRRCAELIAGPNAVVADTRKTIAGLRALQKYAVFVGGGHNHRFNLSDAALIKDNHIDACGSITRAVASIREKAGHMIKIEVEVRTLDELREAILAGAEIIKHNRGNDRRCCENGYRHHFKRRTDSLGKITRYIFENP